MMIFRRCHCSITIFVLLLMDYVNIIKNNKNDKVSCEFKKIVWREKKKETHTTPTTASSLFYDDNNDHFTHEKKAFRIFVCGRKLRKIFLRKLKKKSFLKKQI